MARRIGIALGLVLFLPSLILIGAALAVTWTSFGQGIPELALHVGSMPIFETVATPGGELVSNYWSGLWGIAIGGELILFSTLTFVQRPRTLYV